MRRLALGAAILLACAPAPEGGAGGTERAAAEVARAMERYQRAARAVDPDSTAANFTATGVLFEPGIRPIQGRDSIRAFVASFPGVKVDTATALADTIEVFGSTALLWGTYYEVLEFPGQPTSRQQGRFVAEWLKQANGAWLIQRLYRIPLPDIAPTEQR